LNGGLNRSPEVLMNRQLSRSAIFVLATLPAIAQQQGARTGVSNPEPVAIDANNQETTSTVPAADAARRPLTTEKPSAAKPATSGEAYGAYVPYKGPAAPGAAPVTPPTAVSQDAADALIVTSVPEVEGEISEGTLLRVKMRDELSTATTTPGTKFTAEVMEAITNKGRVIIPIGSVLEGQVTEVHAGKRISGAAALHLEPKSVTLPDGTMYVIHAQLIDTTLNSFTVDREGTLKRRDQVKRDLAVAALATGGGAAAGAVIGGGVGALVGAGVGAGASTVMWLKQERQANLSKDSRLVFSLTTPLLVKPLHAGVESALKTSGSE
jgi:hypothetical protein